VSSVIQIRLDDPSSFSATEKEAQLLANLATIPSLIVALSGGADSAYLAWAAHKVLGDRALSVTAISPSYSTYDRDQLIPFLRQFSIRHEFVETHEMDNASYRANAGDRCYFCKDELFGVLGKLATEKDIASVAYGINADDTADFRPGHRAAAEHHVLTPLLDVRLRKTEIRALSRRAALPTWDRPASACLASRLPYGTEVTPDRLALIDRAEAALRDLGFRQFRVRLHDKLARVEIAPDELPRALTPEMAAAINARLKAAGFLYVSLDLEGYCQGSLNAAL
jgi:pyridinium-3,5-biscarboxylic acid mononucleotide sulfurtransferase